jgi:cytoskeletal protein CcmA (bactofilin family)
MTMAIFSRTKKPEDDEDKPMMDGEAELELPARPMARTATFGRPAVALPERIDDDPAPAPSLREGDAHHPESRGTEPRFNDTRAMEGKTVADTMRPAADMARRLVDPPSSRIEAEARRLLVGREISLQGEITHCDHLVVEGSVTANLTDCRQVEITETGVFKGSVEIEQIEVRGLFEGTMSVAGRLVIRSNGRVVGKVQYGQIEIEIGGQISGEVQALSQPALQTPPRNAVKQGGASATAAIGMVQA